MKPQVNPNHYSGSPYESKERFISYWHQINEIILLKPLLLLDIGIGNGFVSRYLREHNLNVTTLDNNHDLHPDAVGSVLSIPFCDECFDVVSCCEVLEHLPYSVFSDALKEMRRVSRNYVILSLPDVTTIYKINLELPRIQSIKKLIIHPFHRPKDHLFDGQHYWEIGKTGYSREKIDDDIKRSGIKIINTYRIFEFTYHRIYLLKKGGDSDE